MSKLGIIGEEVLIMGWKALGVQTVPVQKGDDIEGKVREAVRAGCKVVLISEDYVGPFMEKLEEFSLKEGVAVSIIPGKEMMAGERSPYLWQRLKKYAERAIGVDILREEE